MQVQAEDIKKKLLAIYPEIEKQGIDLKIDFDEQSNAWMVTLNKAGQELSTHLEKEDVQNCLQGKECYHFGIRLGRFIQYYCEGGDACKT